MTHKQRAEAALNLQIPDKVPTLNWNLVEDLMFGKPFLRNEDLKNKSPKSRIFN